MPRLATPTLLNAAPVFCSTSQQRSAKSGWAVVRTSARSSSGFPQMEPTPEHLHKTRELHIHVRVRWGHNQGHCTESHGLGVIKAEEGRRNGLREFPGRDLA
jgi:hypothetical protein